MKSLDKTYIWDLDIEPKIELLDKEMKRYIAVCNEKLGMVPNVIMANASDPDRLKTFVNFCSAKVNASKNNQNRPQNIYSFKRH